MTDEEKQDEARKCRELNGHELRSRAADGDTFAKAELKRRKGNLRGALVPEWEKR